MIEKDDWHKTKPLPAGGLPALEEGFFNASQLLGERMRDDCQATARRRVEALRGRLEAYSPKLEDSSRFVSREGLLKSVFRVAIKKLFRKDSM